MPKANKKPVKTDLKYAAHTFEPWSCVHHPHTSEIEAYILATGKREVIAEVRSTAGHSAEAIAEFIIQAINTIDKREHLINEMICALEMCLECDGTLDWSAEHDAEVALRHAKERA